MGFFLRLLEGIGKVGFIMFCVFLVGTIVILFCDVITLPITLTSTRCGGQYRDIEGGAGEMSFCIIRPDDDDVEVFFDHSADNVHRTDSVAYLLGPPFSLERVTHKISESFKNDDFKRWHYFFAGDYVKGTVKCEGECTVNVASYLSVCRTMWDKKVANNTDGAHGTDGADGIDGLVDNIVGKKKKKSSRNKCTPKTSYLVEKTGTGTFSFQAEIVSEGPHYVQVEKGLISWPTGTIDYSVHQTRVNISNPIEVCDTYECKFENLTAKKRDDPYVVVNLFKDNMKGTYEVFINYRVSKETNTKIAIGFGIATGVIAGLCLIGLVMFLIASLYEKVTGQVLATVAHSDSGSSSSKSTELGESSSSGDKVAQDATPGDAPASSTPE